MGRLVFAGVLIVSAGVVLAGSAVGNYGDDHHYPVLTAAGILVIVAGFSGAMTGLTGIVSPAYARHDMWRKPQWMRVRPFKRIPWWRRAYRRAADRYLRIKRH
jgi:hypothetical protein